MQFCKHIQIREEKFGSVIFETLKEKVFVTNQTGADIVKCLRENKNQAAITEELASRYGADPREISRDVGAFIDDMTKNEVLDGSD